MRVAGRTGFARLGATVALGAFPILVGTSCASCEAKCVGPHAEINVGGDVSERTVCTDSGRCTPQTFGPAGDATMFRSFTVTLLADGRKIPLTLSAKRSDGSVIAATRLVARPTSGSCGCDGPARIFVDESGGHLESGS